MGSPCAQMPDFEGYPLPGCGCNLPWNPPPDACGSCNGAWSAGCWRSTFVASAPLTLAAGDTVSLEGRNVDPRCYSVTGGNIFLRCGGLYYVTIAVNVPRNTETSTVIQLALDNQTLNPPSISVVTQTDSNATTFTGQAVFYANPGSVLKLVTESALSIETTSSQPVFALTLMRIQAN